MGIYDIIDLILYLLFNDQGFQVVWSLGSGILMFVLLVFLMAKANYFLKVSTLMIITIFSIITFLGVLVFLEVLQCLYSLPL